MRRGILVLVLLWLAGCEWVFPLRDLPADGSDAAVSDAGTDAVQLECPEEYVVVRTNSATTFRFRFVATPQAWEDAERDCVDDTFGESTHLATPDSGPKVLAMIGFAESPTLFWVGAAGDKPAVLGGMVEFRTIGGMAIPVNSELWNPDEPSGPGDVEFAVNVEEDPGPGERTGLNDKNPTFLMSSVCECDTQVIDDSFNF